MAENPAWQPPESPPLSSPPPPSPSRSSQRRSPLTQLAVERTVALLVGGLGGGLLVAAAGSFIAISWDRLGLEAKAGLVAVVALASLVAGALLRDRASGTASVLTHLGGFVIPMDVGGVATAIGLGRAEVGVVAGVVGVIVLTALDGGRSPFMALGRVMSLGAAGLGLAALAGISPSVVFVLGAAAMVLVRTFLPEVHRRHRLDGVGLAALAGIGPALVATSVITQPGSLLDWLAELVAAGPATVVSVALLAAVCASVLDRGVVGTSTSVMVSALAAPSAVQLISDHQSGALISAATAVLASRIIMLARPGFTRFVPWLDAAALNIGVGTILVALANSGPNRSADVGALVAAALLAASWMVSDIESGARLGCGGSRWSRVLRGDSGLVSTMGLALAVVGSGMAVADRDHASLIIAAAATCLAPTTRRGAGPVAGAGLVLATLLAFGNPLLALAIGVTSALVLQGRALHDLRLGVGPRRARTSQVVGSCALTLAVLRFAGSADALSVGWQVGGASLVAAVLLLLASSAQDLPVPDFRPAPRLMTPLVLLPMIGHPEAVGSIALGCALALFLDRIYSRQVGADLMASGHLVLGSWVLAATLGIEASEAYFAAPAMVLLWFGTRATLAGASSWAGVAPGVALLGLDALLERAATGLGWHAALAGGVGVVALAVGVERRWSGPTAVGTGLLLTTASVEVAAVIPRLPVWVLLALAGSVLLATGFVLERRAGRGATASIRAAWQTFV